MDLPTEAGRVTCTCCGQDQDGQQVAQLLRRPDIVVCGGCVRHLAGQVGPRPTITPIFPVHDMAIAAQFWTRAGLRVQRYDDGYAFVLLGGSEFAHLSLRPELDPRRNEAACYVHVDDPHDWHQRLQGLGLPVSDLKVEPWGMWEFSVRDPSGNLIRLGRNA